MPPTAPVHPAGVILGHQNAGKGEPNYGPDNHNFPPHNFLLYGSAGEICLNHALVVAGP